MEIIIKLDHDELVKVKTASTYGEMHPLPDWDPEEQHNADPEDQMQTEIQDLKLENDRLKQREDLMIRALKSICCDFNNCDTCLFKKHSLRCESTGSDIAVAKITLKELEAL